MKVVSFCLYGTDDKYRVGLEKNLALMPAGYEMWVYVGSDVTVDYDLPGARIIRCDTTGQRMMFERMNALDHPDVEIVFFRDADSRILERDLWCMRKFEESDAQLHIIRDHYWHKSKIMGGAWGARKIPFRMETAWKAWMEGRHYGYGQDEAFLAEFLYTAPLSRLLHSSIVGYPGEKIHLIEVPETDDFVGQVYDAQGLCKFRYRDFHFVHHMKWLSERDQWVILRHWLDRARIEDYPVADRNTLLYGLFQACFYLRDYAAAQKALEGYRYAHISDHEIHQTSYIIPHLGKKIVGTTDMNRKPREDEIVIHYGNFAHTIESLPVSNRIFRHACYAAAVKHDVWESDPAWKYVDAIYLMNLETRRDRYIETMAELARVHAPLDRVVHYKAKSTANPAQGATQNHVDCLREFVKSGKGTALFLEDDFTFTSRVDTHLAGLLEFFHRGYDYDVCLLSTSKFGERKPHDDLLDLSYQECTTSAGYLVSRASAPEVLRVVEEGLGLMKAGQGRGVVDRYWACLQPRNKFFVFREKMGYQRCGYSNIKNTVTSFFD